MEPANPKFCRIFENNTFLTIDRVDSPWIDVPDESAYNRRAYRLVQSELDVLVRHSHFGTNPTSRGVLILGEAGTGKTHLLMRIAQNLGADAPLLFIRRPTNEEAVAQHIWENIVDSLRQPAPKELSDRVSQLDRLLNRVFVKILGKIWEADNNHPSKQRWLDDLKSGKRVLRNSLGSGELRQRNFKSLRNSLLNYMRTAMPDVDTTIARVFISYCLAVDENYKRALLNWLTFHELTEEEASSASLQKSSVVDDGSQSQASIQQAREKHALKCIQTLGELSVLDSPLILAFDQLEGLRNSTKLTARWGDVVRELFTMAPNYLVLTCVFPSIWQTWFNQHLDESASQRIAQTIIELEKFQSLHAEQLLAAHLDSLFSENRLPHALYPFTSESIQQLCGSATSVRSFLQAARQELRNWVFDQEDCRLQSSSSTERFPTVTQECISSAITEFFQKSEKQHFNEYGSHNPSEQALFGKLSELASFVFSSYSASRSRLDVGTRVLPPHQVFESSGAKQPVILAVCNAPSTSFTARVTNLLSAAAAVDANYRIVLVRDSRLDQYTPSMTKAISKIAKEGHFFVELRRENFSHIMAFHDCLVAAEEGALKANTATIDSEKLRPYMRDHIIRAEGCVLDLLLANSSPELEVDSNEPESNLLLDAVGTTNFSSIEEVVAPAELAAADELDTEQDETRKDMVQSEQIQPESQNDARTESGEPTKDHAEVELGQELGSGTQAIWEVSIRANPHLMIVGLPGMGKTTSIVNICEQLTSQGIRPIVFSYHEDLDQLLASRISNLKEISHRSLGFNPLALTDDGPMAHVENAGMIRDIFCGIFPELGEIQSDMIRKAVKQSHEFAAATGSKPRFSDFFTILRGEEKPDRGLLARLEELSDFGLFDSTSESESLLQSEYPFVISLHGTKNECVQRAFASLLLYRLYQEMFICGVQDRITHAIVFDEAHRASKLGLLATMAKESRKFGISMVLASQEARDFTPSIFSAIANYLVLRVIDKDARALARNVVSGAATKATTDLMKQLPKYEAVFAHQGQFNRVRLKSVNATRPSIALPVDIAISNITAPTNG